MEKRHSTSTEQVALPLAKEPATGAFSCSPSSPSFTVLSAFQLKLTPMIAYARLHTPYSDDDSK